MKYSELDFESKESLYAMCLGNAMSMAEHINTQNKEHRDLYKEKWQNIDSDIRGMSEEERARLDRAKLLYMESVAIETFKGGVNAQIIKMFLERLHPEYKPKKDIEIKSRVYIGIEHLKRAAELSGANIEEVQAQIIEEEIVDTDK